MTLARRQIIEIDAEKCTGCGECVTACAEGAIRIIDGKAQLVSDIYCDGLGACLGDCPEGALTVVEREAEGFDEEAVRDHLASLWVQGEAPAAGRHQTPASCPSTRVLEFQPAGGVDDSGDASPGLGHWPIKLRLVPPGAPFLRDADLMLIADCVGFAWGDLRRQLAPDSAVLIGCPKFDEHDGTRIRLTEILRESQVRSLTVVHMEVPCCAGYWHLAQEAHAAADLDIPLRQVIIGVGGQAKPVGETAAAVLQIEPSQE
jgi:Pyruvate/2-oxoacid:ferredoxin oxidoreductase delta subunit